MTCDYLEDNFATILLAGVQEPVFPSSFYNEDGNCIEIRLSNESYVAERGDSLVTLFIGRESGQVVGAVIKEIRTLIQQVLESSPGFRVEIMDDNGVRVEHLINFAIWNNSASPYDECDVKKYKWLSEAAGTSHLRVDLREVAV